MPNTVVEAAVHHLRWLLPIPFIGLLFAQEFRSTLFGAVFFGPLCLYPTLGILIA
jgi:hypothetical protein